MFFKSLTQEQGLSQSSIIDIHQSSDGYLWLATQDGLNRFDGYDVTTFKHDPENPHSISDNFIWSITEDREGYLWIGTAKGGLNRFDPKTEIFTRFQNNPEDSSSLSSNQVLDVFIDSQERIWVGTANGGLNRYLPATNQFLRYGNFSAQTTPLNSNTIKVIREASNGKLWLGYSHAPFLRFPGAGFSLFDPDTSINLPYAKPQGLSDNNVTDLYVTDKFIWISSYGGGLDRLDLQTNQIEKMSLPTTDQSPRIMNIEIDDQNHLWMALMGGGLIELSPTSLASFLHRSDESESLTLNDNSASYVYFNNDILWVGTWQEGLNFSNTQGRQFKKLLSGFHQPNSLSDPNVTFITQAPKSGDIWLTNSISLMQYDSQFNFIRRYETSELLPDSTARTIRFVFVDSNDNVWFNCEQLGLFRLEGAHSKSIASKAVQSDTTLQKRRDENKTNYRAIPMQPLIQETRVVAMAELSENLYVVGTRNNGLVLLDTQQQKSMPVLMAEQGDAALARTMSIDEKPAVTKNGLVYDTMMKGWWVATMDQGLQYLSNEGILYPLTEINEQLQEVTITSVKPIQNNQLWIGTQGSGVYRLNWHQRRLIDEVPTWTMLSEKQGLATNAIGAIEESNSQVWVTTTQGLSLYNLKDQSFLNFDVSDGVIPGFSIGVNLKTKDGVIAFGGFTGANYFEPAAFKVANSENSLIINQLLLGSNVAPISLDKTLTPLQDSLVQYSGQLNFHYSLSHFTLGFSSLDYINPKAVKYAYRLVGFDTQWLYTDASRRFATYTNLDPGNYTFELKRTDHFGRWQDHILRLPIEVNPAPWETWWAYCLYVLSVFIIGYLFLLQRLREVRAIKERNEQLSVTSKLFENTSQGVVLFDRYRKVALVNQGFTVMTGLDAMDIIGRSWQLPLVHEQRAETIDDILSQVADGKKWQGELWAERKVGEIFPVEMVVDSIQRHSEKPSELKYSRQFQYVALISDITQRKSHEQKLKELAYYDELTLLPNRSNFERQVEAEIEQSSLNQLAPFAVMFVDLDNFKGINDSLGHNIGDQFLQKLSRRLRLSIEHRITIARLGGDEFLILVPHQVVADYQDEQQVDSETVAARIAQTLYEITLQPVDIDEYKLRGSCSIGIAVYPQHGTTFERLLRNADTAMYEAKKNKSINILCYNNRMNVLARRQFEIAEEMRGDIKAAKFLPFYQLKVDALNGAINGLEVLARWHNEKLGWVSPAQFIPIAEERGLINALSEQVIETACVEVLPLLQQKLLQGRMAINLSPVQFQQVDLVEWLLGIFERADFPLDAVEIEVTESVAMHDRNKALEQLNAIRDLGMTMSLDDFGTGYSSLSYLHQFPLNTVKIDRAFVSEVLTNTDNQKIISAIIQMSHSLGMTVIAEGVESKEQVAFLSAEKCDLIQGYYFHKPCDIHELTTFLTSKPKLQ
ncbi:EAL domain-containing protein [Pleionea litopenaei]|uniref:EAL domain-containing protein n=1 Tax=Pleionea litopenaei TaxID=3070815 RepID=A0AA51RSZ4_9GAMM|nr:EAL domain-containing protein [Pleionea sp. HL-JVS1]WMS87030.1 EAL domain-containing protein [Pleionea sp. HL-JVS1]